MLLTELVIRIIRKWSHNGLINGKGVYDRLISHGVEYSNIIFGTTYKPEEKRIVEALMSTNYKTKEDPDGNAYPDRMQIKLHRSTDDSNKPAAGVYTDTRKPVEINNFDDLIDAIPKVQWYALSLHQEYGRNLESLVFL